MSTFRIAAAVAALSLSAAAAQAGTTVLTGPYTNDGFMFGATMIDIPGAGAFGVDFLGQNGHLDLGPGAYAIKFSATTDIDDLQLVEAANQFSHTDVTGAFPGSFDFDNSILDQYLPGGAAQAYHAGDVLTGGLLVPQDSVDVQSDPFDVFTTTNTYTGVVTVSGVGAGSGPGTWTLTITSVPEPATWALSILGLAALGVAARRRRTAAAV